MCHLVYAQVHFSKTTKLHEPIGQLQFLQEKSWYCLWTIYMKKASQKVKTDKILTAQALFVICTCVTTLHLCYMENALVFSQSKACYFLHVLPTWRSWCTKYISKLPKEGWVILEGERLTNFSICAVGDGPEEREGKTTMYSLVNILVKIFIKQIWSWKLAWKIFFILIAILIEYKNSILTEHEDWTKEH